VAYPNDPDASFDSAVLHTKKWEWVQQWPGAAASKAHCFFKEKLLLGCVNARCPACNWQGAVPGPQRARSLRQAPRPGALSRQEAAVAREEARRLDGAMRLREDPPPDPASHKQGKVSWAEEPAQIRDLVTLFACADYPAGGAPSVRSRRSDGVVPAPTVLKLTQGRRMSGSKQGP
jgi:hypothetical protein